MFASKLTLETAANKEPMFPNTNHLQTTQTREITVLSYDINQKQSSYSYNNQRDQRSYSNLQSTHLRLDQLQHQPENNRNICLMINQILQLTILAEMM